MNDLSVIHSQNTQAQREAEIRRAKEAGHAVAYEKLNGLVSIGQISVFASVEDARASLALAGPNWVLA